MSKKKQHKNSWKNQVHRNGERQEQIPIKGMHCRSCEILIEDELNKIPSIIKIAVNHKNGIATIRHEGTVDMEAVNKAIQDAGYEIGIERKDFVSKNFEDYKDLYISAVILLSLYIIYKWTGLSSLSIGSSSGYSSLPVVLLVGLTAGFSTCMVLVGGLVLGISARHSEKHPEATALQKFRPHIFFNIGRIISFFTLGGLIGVLGSVFQLSGPTLGLLTIIVGFVMIVLGIQLIEIFPGLKSGSFTLPKQISQFFGMKERHNKEYSHKNSTIMGALTFFLPCGFTQAMQLYAISTGSFKTGALVMGIFAIGTMPGLLGVGGLTSIIKGAFAKRFFKFAGLLVIILAFVNISHGYNLIGWKINLAGSKKIIADANDPNVNIENGIQVIRMTQNTNGYSPSNFTIKADIPSRWIIDGRDPTSCSSAIISSKFGIRKILKQGKNVIEFTPKETGEATFSCLMGMYRGQFTIIENSSKYAKESENLQAPTDDKPQVQQAPTQTAPAPKPNSDIQIIKATFDTDRGIIPNAFEVSVGKPVRFEIDAKEDGFGCMSTIGIPGLVDQPELLEKGKTINFSFTPKKQGEYDITCAMGVPFGATLKVN
ncbi:MAG: sulfite exporter TauE/SafE family protein [bacterium]|nr:sulfite exporter TauE/SafE family protein [bacterium]